MRVVAPRACARGTGAGMARLTRFDAIADREGVPGGSQYLPVRFVGRASRNLDASAALWAFFARHRP